MIILRFRRLLVLQVHFKSGLTGGDAVPIAGAALKAELDTLMGIVRQQSIELEEAISQVEQYQQVGTLFTFDN